MDRAIPVVQYVIAIFLSLFILINFGLVGLLVISGLSFIIGIAIILIGAIFSYFMFRFIRNVIIKSINEQ